MRRRSTANGKRAKARSREAKTLRRRRAIAVRHSGSSDRGQETEVVRLRRELDGAQQQQTATAEVLKIISRSTFDLETVFNTLTESAARLCDAEIANIWRPRDGVYRMAAAYGVASYKQYLANKEYLETLAIEPSRGSIVGRTLLTGKMVHVLDIQTDPDYTLSGHIVLGSYRTTLGVPLLREGVTIGVLFLARTRVEPFTQQQIDLVTTFADQAVIAIENTWLLNELRQRTADLTDALEQQTATAEVLSIISSSPAKLEPVFQAILANATRLCDATFGGLSLCDGEVLHYVAHYNIPPEYADWRLRERLWRPTHPRSGMAEAIRTKQPVQVNDLRTSPPYLEGDSTVRGSRRIGRRSDDDPDPDA